MFEKLKKKGFQVLALHHAEAILAHDLAEAVGELEQVLMEIEIPVVELVKGGGGEGALTQRLRHSLADHFEWRKHNFEVKKIIDGVERESVSHEVDHVKRFESGVFALEIEWNNKDPFFDRDLENFKRLHADGAISIGGIITRGASLQASLKRLISEFAQDHGIGSVDDLVRDGYYEPTTRQRELIAKAVESKGAFPDGWAHAFVGDKFGQATTHWDKLEERVKRGVGNPCPLLLIGIPDTVVV